MTLVDQQRFQATAFLRELFERKPTGTVVMTMQGGDWARATGHLAWRPVAERFGRPDVYVGCCALKREPGKGRRGGASEAAFWPGCWADVDVDAQHAPDRETALHAVVALAPPTLIVLSGRGFHTWWLLQGGLVLRDAGVQRRAARCCQALQNRLAEIGGFKVDKTGDLARVLRLPGTINTKHGEPVPVKLAPTIGPRYSLEQLETLAGDHLDDVEDDEPRRPRSPGEWETVIRNGVDVGDRHEEIWRLAGYLLRRDIDPAVARELVRCFNDARVRPPYERALVDKHFDGIARLEVDRRRQTRGQA